MSRSIFIILAFLIASFQGFAAVNSEEPSTDFSRTGRDQSILFSRDNAEKYLLSIPLSSLEGIWEYPANETTLIILRSKTEKGIYDIFLLDSVDCRFSPGMKVGEACASPDPKQFKIELCTRLKKGLLTSPLPCAGKLSKNSDILYISTPRIKVSFSPSIFLPTLWKAIRMGGIRVKSEDPASKIPDGLVKSFPTFDGNPPSRSNPRYL